ncbi:MAG TPA: DinB family protein [Pyrinomonadaceae bacterium]|nr:DinB family protein [Pyrinomonadaceae bacterium]
MTPEERQQLIEQFEAGYAEVERSLSNFPADKLTARPLAGKWTACEIVHHLADSEMRAAVRLRQLLAEDDPQIEAYDQDKYAARMRYNERTDIRPALDAFRAARAVTAQLLAQMTDEDWRRAGRHPEHPRYTTEDWLRIYAAHAHGHASQIDRLREELGR